MLQLYCEEKIRIIIFHVGTINIIAGFNRYTSKVKLKIIQQDYIFPKFTGDNFQNTKTVKNQ